MDRGGTGGGRAGEARRRREASCLWLMVMALLVTVTASLIAAFAVRSTCFGDVVGPWLVISGVLWLALAGGLTVLGVRSERVPWGSLVVLALVAVLLYSGLQAVGPLPVDDCYGNVP